MAFKQGKEKTFQDILAEMLGGVTGAGGFLDEAKGVMDSMSTKIAGVNKGTGVNKGMGVMDSASKTTTEAPLKHLKGIDVMRGEDTYDYDFDVDGKTEGYTFSGDGLTPEAIQAMRDREGITANLGMGATHTMPDGTVMPGASHPTQTNPNFAGTGQAGATTSMPQMTPEMRNVFEQLDDRQKEMFLRGVADGNVSNYETNNFNSLRQGY